MRDGHRAVGRWPLDRDPGARGPRLRGDRQPAAEPAAAAGPALAVARRAAVAHLMDDDNDDGHLGYRRGHWNKDRTKQAVDRIPYDKSIIDMDSFVDHHSKSTVWKVRGPINFISMFEIDDMMEDIKEREDPTYPIVLDMQGVTTLEFTGVEELVNRMIEVADGAPIEMVNCNDALIAALDQCDPNQQILRYHEIVE